jgi:hypothetical protein
MFLGASEVPFVRIGLDPTTAWGHHVFADSEINGPCGRALVEEFIPHLEKEFRLLGEPRGRYLTGHSSGGWSSLWLQICWPDFFGGAWATAPDPVDFHSFCGIDIYAAEDNAYLDPSGRPRPIMRSDGRVVRYLQDFVRMEETLGPGGQLSSFEAVFGPRAGDGSPTQLFDRSTGKINHEVIDAWRRYDMQAKIEREWRALGPKLSGKLTIIVGEDDNFHLEQAVGRLKATLEKLRSDARVIIVPEKDHFTLLLSGPLRGMVQEMSEKFQGSKKGTDDAGSRPCPRSRDQQEIERVFEEGGDGLEEAGAVGAVDDAVIEGDEEGQDLAGQDLAVADDRFVIELAQAEDGDLGPVDQGGGEGTAQGTDVGDGEGSAAQLGDVELEVAGPVGNGL